MVAPVAASTTMATDLAEYYAVMENTTKLSQRRQTTNDILTGINVLFQTAMGVVFVSSHLQSWLAAAIFGLITAFAFLFDITWIRLLNRYQALVGLRIRYLEALEERLRQGGAFVDVEIVPAQRQQAVRTRGIYSVEKAVFYRTGRGWGFIRRERFLVVLFMCAFLLLTAAVTVLTQLIASNQLAPLSL